MIMDTVLQKKAAKDFVNYWKDRGYEKGESQTFWLSLLRDVYGVDHPEKFIEFEDQVHIDKSTGFIDGYISETKVMIEQKGSNKSLTKAIKQSDGSLLTPFQQAKRYITELPLSKHPRWVVTCNFQEFYVYDMERPNGEPEVILLENLPNECYRLEFLTKTGDTHIQREMKISIEAGDIVGLLYDAFAKEYADINKKESQESLNKLCVRLVFCLYAEDAGIFGAHGMFHDYLAEFDAKHTRNALIDLFKVLDQRPEERDPYLNPDLAAFPYVNGGLFADENIEIPFITDEIRDLILNKASAFDWKDISPTIFGAVFESTLNPETRRKGGMHYTSIENIHKVIDPLFLDDLKEEFEKICSEKVLRTKNNKLDQFHEKLASLTFLDPACGSGNFLTETYLSLRHIENQLLWEKLSGQQGQMFMGAEDLIKVSIGQFYGIEINDFAVTVAKTALWIAESQMMEETEAAMAVNLDFLPLKSYEKNIVEGNSLRIEWRDIIPADKLSYIMGNPPFLGYKFQSKEQKEDIKSIASDFANYGTLDYVSGWYIKAAKYIYNAQTICAFVSTNSVTQGEHVSTLWKPLFKQGIRILYARRTFRWDSEASIKAHVHCVIICFGYYDKYRKKRIWNESDKLMEVSHINGYLTDAPDIFIEKRSKPWRLDTPVATKGNAAMDNDFLQLTAEERDEILKKDPNLESVIRRHMSADDFINDKVSYCLWLKDVAPSVYAGSKEIMTRLKEVKEYREASNRAATKKMAQYPMLFAEIRQPETNYIMMPVVSSELRKYIPIAFLTPDIINSYASISIPDADLYHFGVLCSDVHNAWARAVCGRLEMRYRYATSLVYNTFPWPSPTEEQKENIRSTAQEILNARNKYPDCTLADLYDDLKMPPELRTAHQKNDTAVMAAYGWKPGDGIFNNEAACVAKLMEMYQKLAYDSEQ